MFNSSTLYNNNDKNNDDNNDDNNNDNNNNDYSKQERRSKLGG